MALRKTRVLLLVPIVATLSSCMKGDEELQRQLIELRNTADAKTKAAEQLEAQVADLRSRSQQTNVVPPVASSEELVKAKARITELEQRLATASATPAAPPQMGKLDLDEIAGKLEEDLTRKAKQLRELVQRQSPSSRIDEISLKSIEYPPQLITPFNSAITFTVTEGTGTPMRLMFPVTADLSGSWKLPTPDEIQKAYRAALEQPRGGVASTQPQAGRPSSKGKPQAQSQPTSSAGGGARMTQRADGVFVFDWGDGASAAQNTAPPAGQPSVENVIPPGKTGGVQPPAAPSRAPAAAPQAPNVPAPVMPVVGDRIIRFND
jgi:hypothetical protein